MDGKQDITFEAWLAELRQLAAERDLTWIVSATPENHRKGYDKGFTPEDELDALTDLAEWRGCGCGGG